MNRIFSKELLHEDILAVIWDMLSGPITKTGLVELETELETMLEGSQCTEWRKVFKSSINVTPERV